ncbi:MAG TPA: YopX family protein, partial [Candidatus Onthomorpha intestinigallinarum]|nr:YopX family protein [Candidatus Onthomorpha intestinigallinarum]
RTIKFRGKCVINGEWVCGFLADENYINDTNTIDLSSIEVDSDTVGQFTGFKDRSGMEIYEGDIVNWVVGMFGNYYVEEGQVKFEHIEGQYVVVNKFTTKYNRKIVKPLIRCMNKIKVVGNIYDNPELLEGGAE